MAKENAFRDIVFLRDNFYALGAGGRIELLSKAGLKSGIDNPGAGNLNCAVVIDEGLVVAGDNGTILFSHDGRIFLPMEPVTDADIHGLAEKNGLIVAGTGNGSILVSNNGRSWSMLRTEAAGNIISMTSNDSFFIGISDKGEIIKSDDGLNWQVTDYNKTYAGYNKFCFFRKILAGPNSIVIIGDHEDGSPSVLFSTLGNVWTERILVYDDEKGNMQFLEESPNDLTHDPDRDQFILACNGGVLFSLPGCTKCNTYTKVAYGDLSAVSYADNLLAVAGEDFSLNVIRF